jgi:3-mercaptopyruvate sulfurtransferase SseA
MVCIKIFKLILDTIIIYDDFGIAAACRAYFMFQIFNHPNAFILNGGFSKWRSLKNEILNYEPSKVDQKMNKSYSFNHKMHFTLS